MERLEAYDLAMLYRFTSYRAPWLDETVLTLTHFGDFVVLVAVVLSSAALFLAVRRPRLAGVILLAGLLAWSIEWTVKLSVGRPRPHLANALAEPPAQPSFPSGHALGTMAVYGGLGLTLSRALRRPSAPFVLGGVLLSLLVGATRVVIGVHYPFDVLAGWIAGLLCVGAAAALAGPVEPKAPAPGPPAATGDRAVL